jgi:hypothetical protein
MSARDFAGAIRQTLQELSVQRPDLVFLEAGGGSPGSALPAFRAEGCAGVAGASLGFALAGRSTLVTLTPTVAALSALQCFQPDLLEAGPESSWIGRVLLDGEAPPAGRFAALGVGRVAAPATPADAEALLQRAVAEGGVWLYLEDRRLYPYREKAPHPATALRGAICRQAGSDVTLVAAGAMLTAAMRAARLLLAREVEAEVIDLRLLAPLDLETLRGSVQRTHRAIVIDEGENPLGPSIAAAVTEAAFDDLDAPVGVVRVPAGAATLAEAQTRAVPAILTHVCWMLGRPATVDAD